MDAKRGKSSLLQGLVIQSQLVIPEHIYTGVILNRFEGYIIHRYAYVIIILKEEVLNLRGGKERHGRSQMRGRWDT